jgi:hypothetical protein
VSAAAEPEPAKARKSNAAMAFILECMMGLRFGPALSFTAEWLLYSSAAP